MNDQTPIQRLIAGTLPGSVRAAAEALGEVLDGPAVVTTLTRAVHMHILANAKPGLEPKLLRDVAKLFTDLADIEERRAEATAEREVQP